MRYEKNNQRNATCNEGFIFFKSFVDKCDALDRSDTIPDAEERERKEAIHLFGSLRIFPI